MDSKSEACTIDPKQKILLANAALIVYFILPNTISFLLVGFLVALNCAPCASSLITCEKQCEYSINSLFNQYLEVSLTKSTYRFMQKCW